MGLTAVTAWRGKNQETHGAHCELHR